MVRDRDRVVVEDRPRDRDIGMVRDRDRVRVRVRARARVRARTMDPHVVQKQIIGGKTEVRTRAVRSTYPFRSLVPFPSTALSTECSTELLTKCLFCSLWLSTSSSCMDAP